MLAGGLKVYDPDCSCMSCDIERKMRKLENGRLYNKAPLLGVFFCPPRSWLMAREQVWCIQRNALMYD